LITITITSKQFVLSTLVYDNLETHFVCW